MRSTARRWVWRTIRHAAPCLIEGTVIPLIIFTIVIHSVGITPALWASLMWSGIAVTRRLIMGGRVSGVLVLTGVGTTFRLATVIWTRSPFIFFLQPVLGTVATALAFGLSVPLGRPLTAKLGADLVPLEEEAWTRPGVRKACARASLVLAVGLLANAGLTLWMLSSLSVATFVLAHSLVGLVTTLPAIVVSTVVGLRAIRAAGEELHLKEEPEVTDVAPALELAAA